MMASGHVTPKWVDFPPNLVRPYQTRAHRALRTAGPPLVTAQSFGGSFNSAHRAHGWGVEGGEVWGVGGVRSYFRREP